MERLEHLLRGQQEPGDAMWRAGSAIRPLQMSVRSLAVPEDTILYEWVFVAALRGSNAPLVQTV